MPIRPAGRPRFLPLSPTAITGEDVLECVGIGEGVLGQAKSLHVMSPWRGNSVESIESPQWCLSAWDSSVGLSSERRKRFLAMTNLYTDRGWSALPGLRRMAEMSFAIYLEPPGSVLPLGGTAQDNNFLCRSQVPYPVASARKLEEQNMLPCKASCF